MKYYKNSISYSWPLQFPKYLLQKLLSLDAPCSGKRGKSIGMSEAKSLAHNFSLDQL